MLASLSLIFLVGLAMGAICQKLKLPRIIGILVTGIVLGQYVLDLLDPSILSISAELRKMALIIILLKAGLSLDLKDLKKAGRSAVLLSFVPASLEIAGYVLCAGWSYQRMFAEYNQIAGQILMTKNTMVNPVSRENAQNTFEELFRLGVIPIVNENDTVSTYEMQFGDNDTLSAIVSSLVGADLLILLSDIDGLFTDDPHKNPDAKLIKVVDKIDTKLLGMAKGSTGSDVGTGGMATKLTAAKIATLSGADMVIANGVDVCILHHIIDDDFTGTIFKADKSESFHIADFIMETIG